MVYKSGQIFVPFCHNPRVWRTDGRTDRIILAIPRLHYMQRGKNVKSKQMNSYGALHISLLSATHTRTIPVFTPQPQGVTALSIVLIAPTHEGMARVSWPVVRQAALFIGPIARTSPIRSVTQIYIFPLYLFAWKFRSHSWNYHPHHHL